MGTEGVCVRSMYVRERGVCVRRYVWVREGVCASVCERYVCESVFV